MGEEWLWSVPLKNADLDLIAGNNLNNSNFYARSLLSMVRQYVILKIAFLSIFFSPSVGMFSL